MISFYCEDFMCWAFGFLYVEDSLQGTQPEKQLYVRKV